MNVELGPSGYFRVQCNAHALDIPISAEGANAIARILREQASPFSDKRIGNPASPTQGQIDKWLARASAAQRAEATDAYGNLLADLDLSGLEIEL